MGQLELVGLDADGERLVVSTPDGARHLLTIDDDLRTAVLRRSSPSAATAEPGPTMRPREIQAWIRAGASVEEVAAQGGLDVDVVRRYEGPVASERAWIAGQAQALSIGHEIGAPTLGDLVVDRLAARGVPPEVTWDARRVAGEPWEVVARFEAGGRTRQATWSIDIAARSVTALDDESRWLSETELGASGPRRRLAAVRSRMYDREGDEPGLGALFAPDTHDVHPSAVTEAPETPLSEDEPAPVEDAAQSTDQLLDELHSARGVRQPVEELDVDIDADLDPATEAGAPEDDTSDAGHTPPLWEEEPAGRVVALPLGPVASESSAEPEAAEAPSTPERRRRTRRTSVPSWDEIVFGAKSERGPRSE